MVIGVERGGPDDLSPLVLTVRGLTTGPLALAYRLSGWMRSALDPRNLRAVGRRAGRKPASSPGPGEPAALTPQGDGKVAQ